MTKISSSINLNQHYTNNSKTERQEKIVVSSPTTLSQTHLYNDVDANKRFDYVNKEIKSSSENVKNKTAKRFFTFFTATVLTILAALGIKRIFK